MPTRKQIEKMAAAVGRKAPPAPVAGPALLADPRADGGSLNDNIAGVRTRLGQIPQHLLRVGCRRCGRTVEIQKADAARLYGPDAIWKDVGQRLLDNTCTQRTRRHEEDGCWPSYDMP